VRFDTLLEAGGLEGLLNQFFAARLLRPVYLDELERLERYAQSQAAAGDIHVTVDSAERRGALVTARPESVALEPLLEQLGLRCSVQTSPAGRRHPRPQIRDSSYVKLAKRQGFGRASTRLLRRPIINAA
jgi:hypothetical protein